MRSTTIIFALLIVGCRGKTCGVYDEDGNALGDVPHSIGYIRNDVEPESVLPGELRLENVTLVSVEMGVCSVGVNLDGNRLTFTSKGGQMTCTLTLTVKTDDGCPVTTPKEYKVMYREQGFVKNGYVYQATFPVAKGGKISDADIEVSNVSLSTRIELEEDLDGVEIVSVGSTRDGIARFEVRATKLLYLLDDLNVTMIAADDAKTSKARLAIRMTEDSAVPQPEFEKRLYIARLNASDLDSNRNAYPTGMIRLKENYTRVSFDLQTVSDTDLEFEMIRAGTTIGVRLSGASPNTPSQDVTLLLTARVSNQFGHESEGSTTLLFRLEGNRKYEHAQSPVLCDPNNVDDLQTAVIVLSVVIVILLFVIIILFFKYVCVKKPEPATPCKKCSAPPAVKTRRPTPRKISEYPYPLDGMPPPLETLAETDVEEEGVERLEIKVTSPKDDVPSSSGVKTRKRSMTFRESDEESRHYREAEAGVHQIERKDSNESQRRISVEEDRRRRRSSVKMYRCLT